MYINTHAGQEYMKFTQIIFTTWLEFVDILYSYEGVFDHLIWIFKYFILVLKSIHYIIWSFDSFYLYQKVFILIKFVDI